MYDSISRSLGLPTSDLTYDDCKLMIRARQMNLPHYDDIVEIEKLRQKIGYDEHFENCAYNFSSNTIFKSSFLASFFSLTLTNIEEQVVASNLVHESNCVISMPEFALRLQISVDNPVTADLFRIFDTVRRLFINGNVKPKAHVLTCRYVLCLLTGNVRND